MHRQGKSEMTEGCFWVFAYGSLMWRPGFDFAERRLATLHGYRRRFCMTSVHYRGTPEQPGLVLALDADVAGHCAGVVYRVGGQGSEATLAYLRERELVSYAYREITHEVTLDDGRRVEALAYVSDRGHPQYLGGLSLEEQAEVIARAVGPMGPNAEYLMNTVASLDALGVADQDLHRLATLVRVRL
jgi:glutathione-specific gamma-glutamylcyclotransferase